MAFKKKCVGSVCFASIGKNTAGSSLPLAEPSWLKWLYYKFEMHDLLTWPGHL